MLKSTYAYFIKLVNKKQKAESFLGVRDFLRYIKIFFRSITVTLSTSLSI